MKAWVVEAYKSKDLASFAYTVLPGALTAQQVDAAAAQLAADANAVTYVEQTTNLLISFEEDGTYTIVAVGYDASGEAVYHTSFGVRGRVSGQTLRLGGTRHLRIHRRPYRLVVQSRQSRLGGRV